MAAVNVGDEFVLNCGVTVKVVEYVNYSDVKVADEAGNVQRTSLGQLRKGTVLWEAFDDFIGQRFSANNIEVLGYTGRKISGSTKVYEVKCHKCAEDPELFGDALFEIGKSALVAGHVPCGCSPSFTYSSEQNKIRVQRALENSEFEFLGFCEETVGMPTKIHLRCKIDNYEWKTSSVSDVIKSKILCKQCRRDARNSQYLGQKFTLNCGQIVSIVKYDSSASVIVSDEKGNTKRTAMPQLQKGSVLWEWCETSKGSMKLGQVFSLNCGVDVTIIKFVGNYRCIVEDKDGNQRQTSFESIKDGTLVWKIGGKSVRSILTEQRKAEDFKIENRFPLNSRFESNCFGWLTVIGHDVENRTLTIVWDDSGLVQHDVYPGYVTSGEIRDSSIVKNKKDLPFSPKGYYVYLAKVGDVVYYIGSGKGDRYAHVNSGISHNYKLNYHHFRLNDKLEVSIHKEDMTKEESMELEDQLIKELSPIYNNKRYACGLMPKEIKTV